MLHLKHLYRFLCLSLAIVCLGSAQGLAATSHPYRQHAPTLERQAQALMQEGRVVEAIAKLQLAISYNPFSAYTATLYNTLGAAYFKANYPQLALVSFMYASRLQPHYAPYYDNMVKVWQATQALTPAQEQLEMLTLRSPQDGPAWYLLGVVYGAQQQWQLQQQAWRQFIAFEPNSPLRASVCQVVPNCHSVNSHSRL